MKPLHTYRVEVQSTYAAWPDYRVEMLCAALNEAEERVGFSTASSDEKAPGRAAVTLETPPCVRARLFLYVIPHVLPRENRIEVTPPFEVQVRLFNDGRALRTECHKVNPWGGLSVEIQLCEAE